MLIDLGHKLQELREDKGLTQYELSERLGLNFKLLSKWEAGEYIPNLEELLILSDYFEISVTIFIELFNKDQEHPEIEERKLIFHGYSAFDIINIPVGTVILFILFLGLFLKNIIILNDY